MTQRSTLFQLIGADDDPNRFISGASSGLGGADRWLSENIYLDDNDVLRCSPQFNIEDNLDEVDVMLSNYDSMLRQTYHDKMRYYKGDHKHIQNRDRYSQLQSDRNRVVVNAAKNIVNTFNGFFIGIPPKVSYAPSTNKNVAETKVDEINEMISHTFSDSDYDEVFYELSKKADIYGRGYLVAYIADDDDKPLKFTYKSPENAFLVYDNSNESRPMFGVTFDVVNGTYFGTLYTDAHMYQFDSQDLGASGGFEASVKWRDNFHDNPLQRQPITEMAENDERLGLFDDLVSLFDAQDKLMSQKMDDNDYFNNAILYTNGIKEFEADQRRQIKNWHVMQVNSETGQMDKDVDVHFLQKPDADSLQENTLQHLNNQIYNGAQVVNLADQNLNPATSGYALTQRMQPMLMQASTKGSRMRKTINQLLRIILLYSGMVTQLKDADDIIRDISIQFTPNMPHNELEESQIVTNLNGIVSRHLAISFLSRVNNVEDELDAEDADKEEAAKKIASMQPQIDNEPVKPDDTEPDDSSKPKDGGDG